jgi:hypothetical protein
MVTKIDGKFVLLLFLKINYVVIIENVKAAREVSGLLGYQLNTRSMFHRNIFIFLSSVVIV